MHSTLSTEIDGHCQTMRSYFMTYRKTVYTGPTNTILQTKLNPHMFEQEHSISYMTACAPSEDSDQPANLYSSIKVFVGHFVCSQGSKVSFVGSEDSDQPVRMQRLIRVFAESTHNVQYCALVYLSHSFITSVLI